MSQQPDWEFVANIGDATPFLHGGLFLYRDKTGVYGFEMEYLEPPPDEVDIDSKKARWRVWRVLLDKCTHIDGIVSDNKFHPEHPAWFAKPESERESRPQDTTYLKDIVTFNGAEIGEFISMLCSDDIHQRGQAYRMIADYHGWENFDEDPLRLTKAEVEARYTDGELKYRR
jgi:hypothetical protein